jgi:hypothetical protein
MLNTSTRSSLSLVLWLCFVVLGALTTCAQTPLKTIDMPQGGRIVCGTVDGAFTQGAAMTSVLRVMHQNCGEKPQIGGVFKMRGTDSVGVFFTVVNHPAGNVQVAGLIIAAQTGPNRVEAALVSDSAGRFGSSINPMLTRLFSVWHPAGPAVTASASTGANSASASGPATGGHSAALLPMHRVTLQDNTASANMPDGWQLVPKSSGGGTIVMQGPHQEGIALNTSILAQDPTNPGFRRSLQYGYRPLPGMAVLPYNADLVKAVPDLYMLMAHSFHWNPTDLSIDHAEMIPTPQGERCVQAKGHVNNFGNAMMELNEILCPQAPDPRGGSYMTFVFFSLIPNTYANQERATSAAVMASFQWDRQLVQQRTDAMMAPVLAKMQRDWDEMEGALVKGNQRITQGIRQTGANATARMNNIEAANDAQHRAFDATQEDHDRYTQGFSNFLLDQTVIRDVQDPNTHATVWNRAAEAWQRAYPDRIEEVPTSQYIKGEDF